MNRTESALTVKPASRRLAPTGLFILLFGGVLIAAAWGSVLWLIRRDHDTELDRAQDESAFIASAFEEHTRRVLHTADNALVFMKYRYEQDLAVTEGIRVFGTLVKEDVRAVQVAVADAEGNLIYSAVPLTKPINIAANETFRVHRDKPDVGLFVGKPIQTQATGTWAFFLSRRLTRPDGSFAGVVTVGLDPFYFGKVYGNISVGTDRSGILVGRDDHIVRVRISPTTKRVGDDIGGYSPVFREAALRPVGQYELVTELDSKPRIASYRVMPDYPLITIVSIRKADALAAHWDRRAAGLLAASLVTLFVAGFCFFLIRAERRRDASNRALAAELAERRRAEEELVESKDLFTEFMDHMPMMVCLMDSEDNFLFQNKTSREFFGGDMTGRNARDLPVADAATRARLIEDNEKAHREGFSFSEVSFPDGSGGERLMEFIKFRFQRRGKEPHLGSIALDVTDRRKAEKERLALERKMRDAQKMESLGILAGGIAHDFNNLLHGVVGNVDIALAGTAADSPVYTALKRAESAAQRAVELTNQMLAYSGRGKFVIEPVNLSAVVGEMVPLLSSVHSKLVRIDYRMSDDLPMVEADATQLRQVVMNLITNAADSYEGRPGVVRVSTGVMEEPGKPGSVFLEVADEGSGMDRETQKKIFEPFFTTKHAGRGLGLAAVQGIVRGHNGKINLRSEPGKGTTFRISLPLTRIAEQGAPAPASEAVLPPAGHDGLILLVDDEETVRATVSPMLSMHGYRVVTASDGVEALEIFRQRSAEIAAVILDMTMPRMGGAEAFAEMHRIAPGVPVILSSGYSEEEDGHLYRSKGVAGFLQKPYRVKTLVDTLRSVVAERKDSAGTA